MASKAIPPTHGGRVFTCGHCGRTTEHFWYGALLGQTALYGNNSGRPNWQFNGYEVAQCAHCSRPTLFKDKRLEHPVTGMAPPAADGMPDAANQLFNEAGQIVGYSPRAACALLRLAADELTKTYGAQGASFNERVADLVKKGAAAHIQQAFDIARVQGNELLHEAQIRLEDTLETALLLFDCVNWVVEWREGEKRLSEAFAKLPDDKRRAISRRDGSATKP